MHVNSSTKIINLRKAVIVLHLFRFILPNCKVIVVLILHFLLMFGKILHNILETLGCILI